jgi:hypothetical protein
MFKIDSDGATINNEFTEGNPSLGVPATVVSADWLNAVQFELVNVIEFFGLTLDKMNSTQLRLAMLEFYRRGGRQAPINQNILNDQAASNVTGLAALNPAETKGMCFSFDIERKTATQSRHEIGKVYITRDTANNQWLISQSSVLDDSGVVLSITSGGQLQYATDELTGGTYSGELKITDIVEFKV